MYENLFPVGALRPGDNTNKNRTSNQLVQFFLRKFFLKHPEQAGPVPLPTGRFTLDGGVGQQTLTGIAVFQAFARKRGLSVLEDTRVSVATGVFVPGTQFRWTIHALNSFYALRSGATDFDRLFENKEIQAEAPQLALELAQEEQLLRASQTS
jgi:hypothetical protein